MKKILFCVTYYYPHISGLTNYVKNIAELLAKNNFDITVLTARYLNTLSGNEIINNVKTVRVPYLFKVSKGFFMPLFVFYTLRELYRTEQVVICLPQFEGFFVAMLAKLMRKRVHCLYVCDVNRSDTFFDKIITLVLRFSNNLTLMLADNIITLTEDFAFNNDKLLKLSSKVQVISPLISKPKIKNNFSLRKRFDNKKYLIGYVGRISQEKGIEYLIDTIPLLQRKFKKNFYIILAGPENAVGEEKYDQKIHKIINKYKNFVVHVGLLPDDDLGAFYSMLDVLVLPSVSSTEAFGMVQVEAMLCGTPTVASDLPGVRVPIKLTGMGEIVKPKDSEDLAEKIIKVINNKKTYFKNKNEIAKVFSTDKILNQYKKIIN